ncbi:MAG: hypothetical protein KDC54_13230 [Lewinella sp.]|nr:hypothetical protein [Lewinella sp.]
MKASTRPTSLPLFPRFRGAFLALIFFGSIFISHCAAPGQEESSTADTSTVTEAPAPAATADQPEPAGDQAPSRPAVVPDGAVLQLASAQRRTPQLVVDMQPGAESAYAPAMELESATARPNSSYFRVALTASGEAYTFTSQQDESQCLTFLDDPKGFLLGVQPCLHDDSRQQFYILDAGQGRVAIRCVRRDHLFLAAPPKGGQPYFTVNYHEPYIYFSLLEPAGQ